MREFACQFLQDIPWKGALQHTLSSSFHFNFQFSESYLSISSSNAVATNQKTEEGRERRQKIIAGKCV